MRRMHCLFVLMLPWFLACGGSYVDLGTGSSAPEGMSLSVVAVRPSEDGVDIDLRLENESEADLSYSGYSPSQPVVTYQYLTDAAWVQPIHLICGTGLQEATLRKGEHVAFVAKAYAPNRLRRLRVGVASTTGKYVVWSPVIDPATLRAGEPKRNAGLSGRAPSPSAVVAAQHDALHFFACRLARSASTSSLWPAGFTFG